MPKPKVSYSDLEDAFTFDSDQYHSWLDKQTGKILTYDSDIARALERGEDLSGAPDWQHPFIEETRRLLRAFGELPESDAEPTKPEDADRYVQVPRIESHEAYKIMAEFAETVTEAHLRDLLAVALRGSRPFRRFKDVLTRFPAEQERWFAFEAERRREIIEEWAHDEAIEID
jgi:hypothetical protein